MENLANGKSIDKRLVAIETKQHQELVKELREIRWAIQDLVLTLKNNL